jgi:Pyridoxamine 5'-phosphate oxidase
MSGLPRELRELVESGPLAHLSTINADGSPQVSVVWIGLDGDDLVTEHERGPGDELGPDGQGFRAMAL